MKPNAHELDVGKIHTHLVKTVSESPFFPLEAVDLLETMETLRLQRRQARLAIHRKAEKEVALIREREAVEEQQVEAHYGEQIRNVRGRLAARLALGSGPQTESGQSLPSMSAFELEARFDDFAREEMQGFTIQADEHASRSFTAPSGFSAPHMFLPGLRDNSVASASESGVQAPSDEGYHSRFGYCEHRPLGGDPFCDVCLGVIPHP
jgi:hypothetical protein